MGRYHQTFYDSGFVYDETEGGAEGVVRFVSTARARIDAPARVRLVAVTGRIADRARVRFADAGEVAA